MLQDAMEYQEIQYNASENAIICTDIMYNEGTRFSLPIIDNEWN